MNTTTFYLADITLGVPVDKAESFEDSIWMIEISTTNSMLTINRGMGRLFFL